MSPLLFFLSFFFYFLFLRHIFTYLIHPFWINPPRFLWLYFRLFYASLSCFSVAFIRFHVSFLLRFFLSVLSSLLPSFTPFHVCIPFIFVFIHKVAHYINVQRLWNQWMNILFPFQFPLTKICFLSVLVLLWVTFISLQVIFLEFEVSLN